MKHFVGLDFAFANNGIVIIDEDANIITSEVIVSTPKKIDEERLFNLIVALGSYFEIGDIEMVCIEGLSYASKGQAVSQMGAAHFMTRIFLWENEIKYKVISPGSLKKFVTGKGNCKKDLILLKVYKKWGVEFEDDNLADAYSLARMALEDKTYG